MRWGEFYAAVFAIIEDSDGKVLMQRRKDTWFRDWLFQLPSGHIEWKETVLKACQREMKEELWIDVEFEDMEVVHVTHVVGDDRVYFNPYIKIHKYSNELVNCEPDKCSEISFIDLELFADDKDYEYEIETLHAIKRWEAFSEKIVK